ncbi:hypothetical protein NGC89_13750 [Staphylococcus xylosus]|uniref:hypothetical protein n=1 Tax=Staphylococcus xylosus TaxID=1288 RepID=UPI002DBF79EE|nr:hypothetical protein [Staphylococcus xylosus]MEB7802511.1 hypothetical protein [Staphylococcus xylosus]
MKNLNNNTLAAEHLAVLEVLRSAEDKYVTRQQLLLRLNKPENAMRHIRRLINDLIVQHNYMIGSTRENGYYLCETKEDVERAIYTLSSNNEGLIERINSLRRNRDKFFK